MQVKKLTRAKLMGAFMQETRALIRSATSGTIIHLCSGTWDYGITVDRKMEADILADVQFLPFKDSIADTVIFDPPYSKKFKRIYGNYYANRREVFREIIRILKPGGLLIFCHYFIPAHRIWQLEALFMIHNRPWEHVRALSFLRKRATLMPIYPEQGSELQEQNSPLSTLFDGINHAALIREKRQNSPMNWRFSKKQSQKGVLSSSNTKLPEGFPEGGKPLSTLFDNINDVAVEKEKERRQEKRARSGKSICGSVVSKKGVPGTKKASPLEKTDLRSTKKPSMAREKTKPPAAQKGNS